MCNTLLNSIKLEFSVGIFFRNTRRSEICGYFPQVDFALIRRASEEMLNSFSFYFNVLAKVNLKIEFGLRLSTSKTHNIIDDL